MGHVKRAALKLIRCQYSLVWSQINVYILSNESKSYGARSPFLLIKRCSRCNFAINWHFQVAKYRLFSIFLLTFLINAWAKERTAAITNFCSKVFSFKCLNSGNSLGTKANTTGTKSLFQLLFSFFVFSQFSLASSNWYAYAKSIFHGDWKTIGNICLFNLFYNHKCLRNHLICAILAR